MRKRAPSGGEKPNLEALAPSPRQPKFRLDARYLIPQCVFPSSDDKRVRDECVQSSPFRGYVRSTAHLSRSTDTTHNCCIHTYIYISSVPLSLGLSNLPIYSIMQTQTRDARESGSGASSSASRRRMREPRQRRRRPGAGTAVSWYGARRRGRASHAGCGATGVELSCRLSPRRQCTAHGGEARERDGESAGLCASKRERETERGEARERAETIERMVGEGWGRC